MPYFSYKGRNAGGDAVQGVVEALDEDTVTEYLYNNGIIPIEIHSVRAPSGSGGGFFGGSKKVDIVDLIMFTRQLYTLTRAGVPIMRGLSVLQQSTKHPTLNAVIRDLRQSLDNGRDLHTAMQRHPKVFNGFYTAMVRVGEMSGNLDEVLIRLHDFLMFEKETTDSIKTALRYPSFVVLAILAAVMVANLFIIPTFAAIYAKFNAPLPPLTVFLVEMSKFSVAYWKQLLAGIVGTWAGFNWYIRSPIGRPVWDKYKLRMPLAGSIILKATLARFARSFSISSRSGVPFVEALSAVALVVDNYHIGARVEKMREGIERGESVLRTATHSGVFTPIVLQMIAVGEETGALDELMSEVSMAYEREVQYEIRALSQKIEPILLVILGVGVLILALGIFLPMWDLAKVMLNRR